MGKHKEEGRTETGTRVGLMVGGGMTELVQETQNIILYISIVNPMQTGMFSTVSLLLCGNFTQEANPPLD